MFIKALGAISVVILNQNNMGNVCASFNTIRPNELYAAKVRGNISLLAQM